jgi:phosphatidate cytidylyltransferase
MQARIYDLSSAFDDPATVLLTAIIFGSLAAGALLVVGLAVFGRLSGPSRADAFKRLRAWLLVVPAMVLPIVAGGIWLILGITVCTLLCHYEFARESKLAKDRAVNAVVLGSILVSMFAAADHWYTLFVGAFPLTVAAILCIAIFSDSPKGYVQRIGTGVLAAALFANAFGHLGFFTYDASCRPILLWLLFCVELTDIFAYAVGKWLGRRKLVPHTSPGKTLAGAFGALCLTTAVAAALGSLVFRGSPLAEVHHLIALGVLISVVSQFGDLTLSSVKRDLGVKDWGHVLPGQGGVLDRFDSTILAAPVIFHYIDYFRGVAADVPSRIFTG